MKTRDFLSSCVGLVVVRSTVRSYAIRHTGNLFIELLTDSLPSRACAMEVKENLYFAGQWIREYGNSIIIVPYSFSSRSIKQFFYFVGRLLLFESQCLLFSALEISTYCDKYSLKNSTLVGLRHTLYQWKPKVYCWIITKDRKAVSTRFFPS